MDERGGLGGDPICQQFEKLTCQVLTTRVQEGNDIEGNEDQHMANDEEPRGRMMYREKQNWHADIDVNCVPMRKRKYKEREKAEERQKTNETKQLQPDGKG